MAPSPIVAVSPGQPTLSLTTLAVVREEDTDPDDQSYINTADSVAVGSREEDDSQDIAASEDDADDVIEEDDEAYDEGESEEAPPACEVLAAAPSPSTGKTLLQRAKERKKKNEESINEFVVEDDEEPLAYDEAVMQGWWKDKSDPKKMRPTADLMQFNL